LSTRPTCAARRSSSTSAIPRGLTLTTAWRAAERPYRLTAANIDELYDIRSTPATPDRCARSRCRGPCGRARDLGERAPGGVFDEARLATDLGAIVDDHIARFGGAPFAHYTFCSCWRTRLRRPRAPGVERQPLSPYFAASRRTTTALLELLSHEMFHVWNGKGIAPRPLLASLRARGLPPCLWLIGGPDQPLRSLRAAHQQPDPRARSFLDKVLDDWARLMRRRGRKRQSLEAASFDAWISCTSLT